MPYISSPLWKVPYSKLIQGLPTNGTFEWINWYKCCNPCITSITVLFRPNQVMFNNVDSTTNVGHKHQWQGSDSPSWILYDRWNHCHAQHHDPHYIFHIHESFELWMNQDPVPILHPFHLCPRHLRNPRIWKDERSFYLLRSMDRTWLISLEIAKWSKCIHRWSVPPIWRCPRPTRPTTCLPQWSLTIPPPTTVDRWRTSVFRW